MSRNCFLNNEMKWLFKTIRFLVGVLLLLCLISMATLLLRLALWGDLGHPSHPPLDMRLYTGILAAFFLFLCYPIWRILLFRKETPFLSAQLSAMSRFEKKEFEQIDYSIPIAGIDLTRRYDIYYSAMTEDRLFRDVKILGIKMLERMNKFSTGVIGGWIEIEASNGTKMLIRNHSIQMICETGSTPVYEVIPRRPTADSKTT